jgi:hypothetical protein
MPRILQEKASAQLLSFFYLILETAKHLMLAAKMKKGRQLTPTL